MDPEERIPISLITGFLGSGKTTLLNRLLAAPEMAHSIVLVNEFGQISIDTDLISRRGEATIELSNGCVCCTLNEDLGTTLHGFLERRARGELPNFRRVLIETTGLANAGPIVRVILENPQVVPHYTLDRVISTVDAVLGMKNLDLHAESVEQVAVADCLVLTKLDLISDPASLTPLRERLLKLNPAAPIIDSRHGDVDVRAVIGGRPTSTLTRSLDLVHWLAEDCAAGTCGHDHHAGHSHGSAEGHAHAHGRSGRHDDHIASFCLVRDRPVARAELDRFWSGLAERADPNLLRVKGLVNVAEQPDRPVVIQGVQQLFGAAESLSEWPSEDRRTRIVFIGWKLDKAAVEELLVP